MISLHIFFHGCYYLSQVVTQSISYLGVKKYTGLKAALRTETKKVALLASRRHKESADTNLLMPVRFRGNLFQPILLKVTLCCICTRVLFWADHCLTTVSPRPFWNWFGILMHKIQGYRSTKLKMSLGSTAIGHFAEGSFFSRRLGDKKCN